MGNVLATTLAGDGDDGLSSVKDDEFLNLQSSVCFNSSFVNSVYPKLPKYQGTEVVDGSKKTPEEEKSMIDSRSSQLMNIFAKAAFGGMTVDSSKVKKSHYIY